MKKILALTLAAVLALSVTLTGCGSNSNGAAGSAATDGKQLSVQIGPNPESIDPALNVTTDGSTMILHAFETLLTLDQNNQIQPGQAESWEVSEDNMTWTFHLRPNLKWSDGTDLTANDFVYTWKRAASPETAAPYADTALGMVKGFDEAMAGNWDALAVSAPDENTFIVELGRPCTYFEQIAAFVTLSPVQQATVEENGESWATSPETYVSNGPFYMTDWVVGSHITLTKNPYYWNADAIKLDSIKFVLMEDDTASFTAYQSGEVLIARGVPSEEISSLVRAEDGGDFHVAPIMGTYYLTINTQREYFQDVRVRQALSLVIDRDFVSKVLMQGTYSPAHSLVGPGIGDADPSVAFMDQANNGQPYIDNSNMEANLEKAKALMAEAGYPNGEGFPVISYLTNDTGYHKTVAEYLQQVWGELGITMSVDIVEWSSFTSMRRAGDFDIGRNGWIFDYNDPSSLLECLMTGNGNNDGKYSNPEYDATMELSYNTTDVNERFEALHHAEDILMEDMVVLPIAYYNSYWLQSPKLTGSWVSPCGYYYLMYSDIV